MFISEAYAQAASGAAAQPGGLESMFSSFGVMILILPFFWFLLIRPQQKRQKEHKKMIDALTTGNEVITAGGICGKIVAADENYINLQIAAVDEQTRCHHFPCACNSGCSPQRHGQVLIFK